MIAPKARLGKAFPSEEVRIKIPSGLYSATGDLVVGFAEALAEKLHKADLEYGHGDSWIEDDWRRRCQRELIRHIKKGDPRDVAAYCAFMWYHGWPTVFPKRRAHRRRKRHAKR